MVEMRLKKYHERSPIMQKKLIQAKHDYRVKAIVHRSERKVEEAIEKAQKFGSKLPLLQKIRLAHTEVAANFEAITKAEQQLAQNRQEMRKQSKNIASLEAERQRKVDEVLVGPTVVYTHDVNIWSCLVSHDRVCLDFLDCVCRLQTKQRS